MQGNYAHVGFEISAVGGKEFILVEDPSKRPVNYDVEKLRTSTVFLSRTGASWYPTNNISLTGGIQDSSALFVKAKINLLNGYRDDPERGLFYLALFFESTHQEAKKSGDHNGAGGATGYPWEGSSQMTSGTSGISLGYQLFKRAVPFIGYNFQRLQTKGTVKQQPSLDGFDSGGEYELSSVVGTSHNVGFGIEFRPRNRFFITTLVQSYELSWGGDKVKDVTGSIRLTYVPL